MSGSGLVVLLAVLGFAGGVAGAVRLEPPPATGPAGRLVQWVSRLVAGAAVATLALDIYAVVKGQADDDLPSDPVELADGLTRVFYDAGVLFTLAVGLAVVGSLMRAKTANPE